MRDESPSGGELPETRPAGPPASLGHSAGFLLNRTARLIRERTAAALEPLGITPPEMGLMRVLSDEGPLSQQELSRLHNIDRTTIVHLVDELEAKQLVIRMVNPEDRRSHRLYLTPRGNKVLSRARRLANREQQRFLAPLSDAEWESMRLSLIKLLAHHLYTGRRA